jgi:hypothetical protein
MKDMLAGHQCFIGTVNKDGIPNVAPKRSTRVLNDETLVFNEATGGATYENIVNGSKVSVAFVDREIPDGYRFLCDAELQSEGAVYEQAKQLSLKKGIRAPKAVALLHITEIHSLKPGPTAGKKIG